MRYFILALMAFLLSFSTVIGQKTNQELKLAQQYYQKGEYEKATPLYKKLYETNDKNVYYYRAYLKCLVAIKDYESSEKLIKKMKKKAKSDPSITVDMGYLYRQQDQAEKAQIEFDKAIKEMGNKTSVIRSLANTFNQMEEYKYVAKTYEKGREMMGDPNAFSYELALNYKKQGDYSKMMEAYLDYIIIQPNKEQMIKNEFQGFISMEKYRDDLMRQLYSRIQKQPDELIYPELLIWLFIQEKDFASAGIQVKALDKRLNENGMRVFDLAQSALIENQFEASIDAYQYVIDKGPGTQMYERAKMAMVGAKMKRLQQSSDFTQEDVAELEGNFLSLLDEFGRNPNTTTSMRKLSNLYAFYLFDLDKAIAVLEEVIEMPAVTKQVKARSKLDLGDYYIMKGEVWEATLYYAQVDKEFKDDILGEEARFRNAKLSYYTGDFDWSQAQLNILKASTSELISNDAIDLSVFMIDNMGLDTTTEALNKFAKADLLIFQNKVVEAYSVLDSLESIFPGHALADDILFRRGQIEYKRRDYVKASEYWEKVVADFGTDILADNAIFHLAEIYETFLEQPDKAKQYYQTILVDFPSSLFTVEARKRFRRLRGDTIN